MVDRNDPERLKSRLDQAAEACGLSKENHDLTVKQCFESSMSPDEPTIVMAVMANYVGQVQKPLLTALNDVPARIEDAAARAVGPVAEAATATVEAAHAALTADVGQRVSELTERRLAIYERERARKWNVTLVAGGASLLAAGCLIGYGIGAADVSGLAADIAVFAKRADAATWLQLMSTTPDLTGNVEKFCTPDSPETFKVLTGRQACGIWFWMDGNAAPQLKSIARGLTKTTSDAASILPWYVVGVFWMAVPLAIRWALKKMNAGAWLEGLSKALKN
ncbi:hypothetical protein [Bosea beijingensis]|uniref:hypothetical protein n=1 Tax=Bosea beijingensis TaxID=3068632 RepID=UPI0027424F6C|nr:hypothetical protein [Bosea sp. REN20]